MPRTYHFMGWNRDRDAEQPCLIAPLEPIQFIDDASAFSPAVWDAWDAMTAAMVFGTGAVVVGGSNESYGRGVMALAVDLARPSAERTVVQRIRPARRWHGKPMFTLKDDDPQITWDDKAMAARPFRARKD